MANSTPIDPRRLGQRSAGGFTPVDLKAGAANLRGTSKPKTPVPAPTPVRENRSKPRDYSGILRAEFGQDAITSGYRSQAEQNALVKQGVTSAKRSSHTYNNGFDLSIGSAKSEEEIRKRLGARGINVTKVIRETGQGRNQGTGPHWHIEIDGPTGNRQAGAGSAAGKMNVQSSQVQGPSGSVNTGVSNQSQRTMTAGPAIERKQQNVESKVANAGAVLDDLLSQMSQTQDARIEAKTTQVSTTRAINQEMTAATQDMIQRVKPVFERQKAIADQALEIQSMSPIARAVRGFFDLNYNQDFLMNQLQRNNAIIQRVGQTYQQMQAYHADAINQTETLYQINTALPELELANLGENAKAAEMQLQQAETDLDATVNGVRNEIGLINSQRAVRNDILNRIDLPTAQSLLGQAEQSGVGVVNFNGVTFSSQELRDVANQREDYELSKRSALLGYAANEAEFADAQASRMVQYATDAQIEEAIDNGGVMDGVQIAPGVLTQEKTRRVQAAIDQAEITEFETTPLQAAKNAYSMANYARTTALKADSIFGPTTIADEQIAFSNQIRDISNKIRTATQNGASDVEIGVLNQQLMKARDSFNAAVQAKVTRLVGNDKEGAAYVTSYLAGDRPTPGAAADMMVHFAARGGLPSAMESSQFGYNAMTEVMNTIESVRSQKNPATGRARSTAEVLRESARLLADPRSPEGQKFRQSTRGLQFQATFQRLPIYARDRDGNVTHPFGLIDPSAFAQATRTADATGLNEIARANGLETSQLVQLLAGETPKDLEPDRLKELDLTKLGADVSSAQQRILVNLLDQMDRASPDMRNSALMLDFLESPQASRAFQMVEGMSDSGGFADWMAGSVGRGGLNQNFGNYSQGYRGAVAIQQESDTQQALRLAMGYRNDVSKRTGALLMANGFNRGDAVTLARAIGPLIPQGTPAEKEAQRVAAMSDQGSAAMENQFTYRSDLARKQIAAVDQIILTHKFDDPNLERLRKKAAQHWEETSSMADNFIDGLIGN